MFGICGGLFGGCWKSQDGFILRWFRGLRFDVGVYRIKVMESGQGGDSL